MGQANSAEEHKLVTSFEEVRRTLLKEEFADRMDKPLAYWALPNDRRLPLAFLGRSLGELLSTPFSELTATRGIGHKKISSLVKLLHRATNNRPPAVPYGLEELNDELDKAKSLLVQGDDPYDFDPTIVSEALWVQWCDTVRRFNLGYEPLGRLALSLQSVPTVIWKTRLGDYLDLSLSEIRQLRTHGEKRVRTLLQVFHAVHQLLANSKTNSHLSLRLTPKFIPPIEDYLSRVQHGSAVGTRQELTEHFAEPLLKQIEVDSGPSVSSLARSRLGVGAEQKTVRDLAHELELTRARVYQLLEDCAKVMEVRWPEGQLWLVGIRDKLTATAVPLFDLSAQLFFPGKEKLSKPTGIDRETMLIHPK